MSWEFKVDFRVGKIISAKVFAKARKPAYQLKIDFGPVLGVRQSSAQLTFGYPDPASLEGRTIIAVVNFPPRSIAGFQSQVLVTGFCADHQTVFLAEPLDGKSFPLGSRVGPLVDQRAFNENITGDNGDTLPLINLETFSQYRMILGRVTDEFKVQIDESKETSNKVPLSQKYQPSYQYLIGKRIVILLKDDVAHPLVINDLEVDAFLTCDRAEMIPLGQSLF